MLQKLLNHLSLGRTTTADAATANAGQQAPLADATTPQVQNSAGGYAWAVDDWTRLQRFLILGSESGSYYASPAKLTQDNADVVLRCMIEDGLRTVQTLVELSEAGRAPKQDPTILALALCLKLGELSTRKAAADAVPRICRTGSHLLQLAAAVEAIGGWGRVTRRAFSRWYQRPAEGGVDRLAYQVSKYRQRGGWSHRDVLRKAHPAPPDRAHDALYRWIVKDELAPGAPARVGLVAQAKEPRNTRELVRLIEDHGLVREELPTQFLQEPEVWRALLRSGKGMPMTAMLRNLAKMTSIGLFQKDPASRRAVCSALRDRRRLQAARVHPLAVLVALNTYKRGRGVRGSLSWSVDRKVLAALDEAFSLSFDCIPRTGQRWMLAVDVSGSMGWKEISGMTGITPRIGAAAMALATLRSESKVHLTAFSHGLREVDLGRRTSLEQTLELFDAMPMGATDCALPMIHAAKHSIPVDTFVVYTDSETWYGGVHPAEALRRYREKMGIPARLIVCGMVANRFTIADPDDPGMLDVVGFDTRAPALMAEFSLGRLD